MAGGNWIKRMELRGSIAVFDLGKVLLDFDYSRAAQALAPHSRISTEDFRSLIDQSPLLEQYETGALDDSGFFEAIRTETGLQLEEAAFQEKFADIFTPIPEMIAFLESLRARAIPTVVFSNTNGIAIRHIRSRYPFFSGFSREWLSFEQGRMKPDPELYTRLEQALGTLGEKLVFVDDKAENIETARQQGWRVVHHIHPSRSIESMSALLMLS